MPQLNIVTRETYKYNGDEYEDEKPISDEVKTSILKIASIIESTDNVGFGEQYAMICDSDAFIQTTCEVKTELKPCWIGIIYRNIPLKIGIDINNDDCEVADYSEAIELKKLLIEIGLCDLLPKDEERRRYKLSPKIH
jgi:hypothetical protein